MKKSIIYGITVLMLFGSFKRSGLVNDYRNSYEGNYFCIRHCQIVNDERNGLTTLSDTITIQVKKDEVDSILNIKINNSLYRVKLKNAKMYPYPSGRWGGGVFFANDSLRFSISSGKILNMCNYSGRKKN